jgi:hypothetical protein
MTPEIPRERAGPVPPSRGSRGAFLAVLAVAFLHALFYAVFMPAWNSANEPQHLDYPVGAAIVASGWGRLFGGGQPSSRAAWPGPSRSPMTCSS